MDFNLVGANAVIVADKFNPSIINQLWLVKNGILIEEDFQEGSIITPLIVQIKSREFTLMVMPEQLQFSPTNETETESDVVYQKVGRIIEKLPHTPFIALGLNFTWYINPEDIEMGDFTRSIFYRDTGLYREFDTKDARFGGYLSKDVFGFRLKLDIKPISKKIGKEAQDILRFGFNFHHDLRNENKVEEMLDLLKIWKDSKILTSKIVKDAILGSRT